MYIVLFIHVLVVTCLSVCLLFILLFAFVNTLAHVLQGACSLLHLVQVELVKHTVL